MSLCFCNCNFLYKELEFASLSIAMVVLLWNSNRARRLVSIEFSYWLVSVIDNKYGKIAIKHHKKFVDWPDGVLPAPSLPCTLVLVLVEVLLYQSLFFFVKQAWKNTRFLWVEVQRCYKMILRIIHFVGRRTGYDLTEQSVYHWSVPLNNVKRRLEVLYSSETIHQTCYESLVAVENSLHNEAAPKT